jgi:hypothetical protein
MDIQTLAERCIEDTQRYRKDSSYKAENCFELMRIALAENNNAALTEIYRIYRQLIRTWVMSHPGFAETEESAEYFMLEAFSSFYFAVRHEKFSNFLSIAKLLSFLKACVHTSILLYLRKRRLRLIPIDEVETEAQRQDFDGGFHIAAIWERICYLLPAEQDRRLAHLAFVQERKVGEIATLFPEVYFDARVVSIALQRIRRILKEDKQLRDLLGA